MCSLICNSDFLYSNLPRIKLTVILTDTGAVRSIKLAIENVCQGSSERSNLGPCALTWFLMVKQTCGNNIPYFVMLFAARLLESRSSLLNSAGGEYFNFSTLFERNFSFLRDLLSCIQRTVEILNWEETALPSEEVWHVEVKKGIAGELSFFGNNSLTRDLPKSLSVDFLWLLKACHL